MSFSEPLKSAVKQKANFTCCWCQDRRNKVDVHHIVPESQGGPDTEENAAPLCGSCHDLYGNNPDLRKEIRSRRDHLYKFPNGSNSSETLSNYAEILRSTAIGFREQVVVGRLDYARIEMSRGDSGFRSFLGKIGTQRVLCPVLMSAELTKLTPVQCEMLSCYCAAERELDLFITDVLNNKAKYELRPRDGLTGFLHRLGKLSDTLDHFIESLEPE